MATAYVLPPTKDMDKTYPNPAKIASELISESPLIGSGSIPQSISQERREVTENFEEIFFWSYLRHFRFLVGSVKGVPYAPEPPSLPLIQPKRTVKVNVKYIHTGRGQLKPFPTEDETD